MNKFIWAYRQLTSPFRATPNLQIVGTQKGGTSSLYNYLTQHPQILPSLKKEMHYFSGGILDNTDNFSKGLSWYKAHFPLKLQKKRGDYCVDATPMYLFNPLCAARIHSTAPHSKIIIILRDPVQRAISHYYHSVRHGFEYSNMFDAMTSETERLEAITANKDYRHPDFRTKSYLSRGLYLEQVKRFIGFFGSESVLILQSEELFNHPLSTLDKVYQFLDIDRSFTCLNVEPVNIGNNKGKVETETLAWLEDYFRDHNTALYEYLDVDYGW